MATKKKEVEEAPEPPPQGAGAFGAHISNITPEVVDEPTPEDTDNG